ncbi:hypothetical protein EV127DRAFT_246353 [Xylaria flabelliformis]|nr:hypothetical protein EV127DRAFT_246353 [Xylaria flabelliformis]
MISAAFFVSVERARSSKGVLAATYVHIYTYTYLYVHLDSPGRLGYDSITMDLISPIRTLCFHTLFLGRAGTFGINQATYLPTIPVCLVVVNVLVHNGFTALGRYSLL